jgi:hypothetical protein
MELPRYIPLTEAAKRYNVDYAELAQPDGFGALRKRG